MIDFFDKLATMILWVLVVIWMVLAGAVMFVVMLVTLPFCIIWWMIETIVEKVFTNIKNKV